MGLCGSSPIFNYTDVQLKELKSASPVFDLLGIKWNSKEAQAIHSIFDHAVDNSDSEANVNQLCKALKLPREHFYTQSFVVFGNKSKSVQTITNKWQMAVKASVERCSMSQFVAGLWSKNCAFSAFVALESGLWTYLLFFFFFLRPLYFVTAKRFVDMDVSNAFWQRRSTPSQRHGINGQKIRYQ